MSGIALSGPESVAELVRRLGGEADVELAGARVERVVSPWQVASSTDLVVVSSPRALAGISESAGVFLCTESLAARVPRGRRIVHPHAEWALAELLTTAAAERRAPPPAEVSADADVHPSAVVLPGARIGARSRIGPNAVVYGGVSVGADVDIGASAVIGRPGFGFVDGPAGRVLRMPQLGGVVIEDAVEIGALSSVDAGTLGPTRIGQGSKLDAQVHVGHNVEIGPGCRIAAQVGFAGSVVLGAGVFVGGQAGFKDHVRVGDRARVGAKSGVIGDVAPGQTVAGFPAVPRVQWLRAMARLVGRASRS
ncbi:MAG: UDP-3-O-(3-hydroxymyristoyl)glucosamine N-acyltransferase [Polyangiaceae bacterium]